ncbi:MAG: hypothetical protein EOP34_08490 [Rickettsiales bacterium]|nr:MAG: hypothetical protein EOP34_08490 [Rickettsiales bacterium]
MNNYNYYDNLLNDAYSSYVCKTPDRSFTYNSDIYFEKNIQADSIDWNHNTAHITELLQNIVDLYKYKSLDEVVGKLCSYFVQTNNTTKLSSVLSHYQNMIDIDRLISVALNNSNLNMVDYLVDIGANVFTYISQNILSCILNSTLFIDFCLRYTNTIDLSKYFLLVVHYGSLESIDYMISRGYNNHISDKKILNHVFIVMKDLFLTKQLIQRDLRQIL